MKTPDEIKKSLEACGSDECHGHHAGCPYEDDLFCTMHICGDALAYIQQLERERDEARNDLDTINYANTELYSGYEAMKRERDAAVELLHGFCGACANEGKHEICVECSRRLPFEPDDKDDYWQWRGVHEEVKNNAQKSF